MPKYRVQMTDGRIVTVQADQPPTEEQILSQIGPRQTAPDSDDGGGLTAAVGSASLLAKAAPAIVSGVRTLAKAGGSAAATKVGRLAPGVVALDAAGDVLRGDMKGAVQSGLGAAAMTQVPKVLGVLERAAAPSVGLLRNAAGQFVKGSARPGILARGAGALSKAAGAIGTPLTIGSLAYETGRDLSDYANDPTVDPAVREAITKALLGGGM